jgi:hypothetical protein
MSDRDRGAAIGAIDQDSGERAEHQQRRERCHGGSQNRRAGAAVSAIPALPRFRLLAGRGGHGVGPSAGGREARPVQVSTSP